MSAIKQIGILSLSVSLMCQHARAQQRDSLDIKIGQMILIGVPGTEADPLVLKEVREGKAGSIIFFEKNISSKNSFKRLRDMAWAYQQAAPIPLFISIDEEGGRVNRLKEKYGFPKSVSAADMGKSLDSAHYYSETTAATLVSLGININFAPVVDLASNPDNPVIAKAGRSFSAFPDTVTLYAKEFIRAHRKLGVITTLKHFPGHGSSKDDTHFGIADVTKTWEANELKPYQSLIDSGYVDAIMTAHIVNKSLDNQSLPGTLSIQILDSLLRKSMKFDGVVFSDDMQMHAITKHFGFEEAIKLAVNAGVDILTFSNNIQGSEDRTVDRVHSIIKNFVMDGTIPESRIEESYRRIMKLKKKIGVSQADYYRTEWLKALAERNKFEAELKKTREALEELRNKAAKEEDSVMQSGKKKKKN